MGDIILIACLGAGLWFWWESRAVAEQAMLAATRACNREDVVLLNDTVAWEKIRLVRQATGRMGFERQYFFEFSTDIDRHYRGQIIMQARRLQSVSLEPHRL